MHIIIGLITATAGLIWALYRLQQSGVDLNSFNPFHWLRRKKWEAQVGTKPLHRLDNSMEAAAVLIVAMAELDGTVTRETKSSVLQLFIREFELSEKDAAEMYATASYLLKEAAYLPAEVKNILAPSKDQFQPNQTELLLGMLAQVSTMEGEANQTQTEFLEAVRRELI